MSHNEEPRVAQPAHSLSDSRRQFVGQLFSWWPYLFIVISVVGFTYIFWQQSQR